MRPVVAVVGPTAVGKSALAAAIARRFEGDVVNGDAFQCYRGLDIATAKPTPEERAGVVHRLYDILPPDASFSVAAYQRLVRAEIADVRSSGRTPILCGGSGLYVQAALYDYRFIGPERDRSTADTEIPTALLYERLRTLAPEDAATVDPANRRRILRRLEILAGTSGGLPERTDRTPIFPDLVLIGLDLPRPLLVARIDARVDRMVAEGLVAEARRLYDAHPHGQAAEAIGYRELFAHFRGETTLAEAVAAIKVHTRQFAKRQLTWFRNRMDVIWFDALPPTGSVVEDVLRFLATIPGIE